jgi:hypothetical protein
MGQGIEALFDQLPAAEDHPTFRLDFEPEID